MGSFLILGIILYGIIFGIIWLIGKLTGEGKLSFYHKLSFCLIVILLIIISVETNKFSSQMPNSSYWFWFFIFNLQLGKALEIIITEMVGCFIIGFIVWIIVSKKLINNEKVSKRTGRIFIITGIILIFVLSTGMFGLVKIRMDDAYDMIKTYNQREKLLESKKKTDELLKIINLGTLSQTQPLDISNSQQSCDKKYPGTVYQSDLNKCICSNGNDYNNATGCNKNIVISTKKIETKQQSCNRKYPGTTYQSNGDKCICPVGSTFDNINKYCKKQCGYSDGSKADIGTTTNNNYICTSSGYWVCKSGYFQIGNNCILSHSGGGGGGGGGGQVVSGE